MRLYVKWICDEKYDWLRLDGVYEFVYDIYVCMYRMTNDRLEVRIFFSTD